jgi:hypothetical protein
VPARVDRLPWTPFHTRLVAALGVAWVLDGLEITVASSVAGAPTQSDTLHLSSTAVGAIASVYLAGEAPGPAASSAAGAEVAQPGRARRTTASNPAASRRTAPVTTYS